jgi:lipopolysaccharide export system protein LptC
MAFAVVSPDMDSVEQVGAEAERRARAFAAARRHSILVKLLRFALKAGALGVVFAMIVIGVFQHLGKPLAGLSGGALGIEGTKVSMDSPRLTGFRKDGKPYLVNAAKAMQDTLHPTIVELSGIDADLATSDNVMVKLTARSGIYDTSAEHLDVADNVRLKSQQYDVAMKSASIDFKNGLYASKEAVSIVTSTGMKVDADSFSANDSGRELQFVGNVRSLFRPAAAPDDAPLTGAPQ